MSGRASDQEALRMTVAFYCIMEPERRAELVALAEQYAKASAVVEGCTHFLLLQNRSTTNPENS
jgi:quinol monooxygenase YgiN